MVRIWRHGRDAFFAACLVSPFLSGCASTVDTITSQRFREKPFGTMFSSEDPLEVLKKESDSDMRAKAMLSIKEPKRHGGTEQQQNEVIEILTASATSDKQGLCRLHAIEALSRFEDPRATQVILTAYQKAGTEGPLEGLTTPSTGVDQAAWRPLVRSTPINTFSPETVMMIQCKAVESLGRKKSSESLTLLCDLAATPPPAPVKEAKPTLESLMQAGNTMPDNSDLRLAAIRALANYKGDAKVAEVLYKIKNTERDIAIKNRAHLSLVEVAGKDYEERMKAPKGKTSS